MNGNHETPAARRKRFSPRGQRRERIMIYMYSNNRMGGSWMKRDCNGVSAFTISHFEAYARKFCGGCHFVIFRSRCASFSARRFFKR